MPVGYDGKCSRSRVAAAALDSPLPTDLQQRCRAILLTTHDMADFPLHRAVDAALTTLETGQIAWGLLAQELAVGLAWGAVGYLFLRWMIQQARRRATLQLL